MSIMEKKKKMKGKAMPKISVIIPVYNTEKYVKRCLESVKNQIFKDIEIIVVNDGSIDSSKSVIQEFIDDNKQLNIIYIDKKNGGLSDARNFGIKYATGEYLCFIDSDDYIDINLFSNLEKYINKKVELIKYKFIRIDENNNEIERSLGPEFDIEDGYTAFNKLYTNDNYLEVAWLYMYNKEFWEKNNFQYPKGRNHEDFALTPLIIIQAKSVVSTNEYGYYYTERKNSITTSNDYAKSLQRIDDLIFHYDNMLKQLKDKNIDGNIKKLVYEYYTNTILYRLKDIRKDDRKKYIEIINERRMLKNIIRNDMKSIIKYMLLKCNINLYVKIIDKKEKLK